MPNQEKLPLSVNSAWVGTILLILSAGLFVAFVPIVDCPGPSHHRIASYYGNCPRCGKERGISQQYSLLRSWFWRPTTEEKAEYELEIRAHRELLGK
jgi:hypothetical protein